MQNIFLQPWKTMNTNAFTLFKGLSEIQLHILTQLTQQQSAFAETLLNTGIKQVSSLYTAKDPKSLVDAQLNFTAQCRQAVTEHFNNIGDVMTSSLRHLVGNGIQPVANQQAQPMAPAIDKNKYPRIGPVTM